MAPVITATYVTSRKDVAAYGSRVPRAALAPVAVIVEAALVLVAPIAFTSMPSNGPCITSTPSVASLVGFVGIITRLAKAPTSVGTAAGLALCLSCNYAAARIGAVVTALGTPVAPPRVNGSFMAPLGSEVVTLHTCVWCVSPVHSVPSVIPILITQGPNTPPQGIKSAAQSPSVVALGTSTPVATCAVRVEVGIPCVIGRIDVARQAPSSTSVVFAAAVAASSLPTAIQGRRDSKAAMHVRFMVITAVIHRTVGVKVATKAQPPQNVAMSVDATTFILDSGMAIAALIMAHVGKGQNSQGALGLTSLNAVVLYGARLVTGSTVAPDVENYVFINCTRIEENLYLSYARQCHLGGFYNYLRYCYRYRR